MPATTSADGDWLVELLTATLAITSPTSPFMLWLATHHGETVDRIRSTVGINAHFSKYVEAVVTEAVHTHGHAATTAIHNVLAAAEDQEQTHSYRRVHF
jgi:2-keto-3-deoxy-galactonokinase